MKSWPDDRDHLDGAIDEAARRMTEGAPDAAFTARVLARLDRRPRSRRVWILAPLAAAAAIAVAVLLYSPRSVNQEGASVTGVVASTPEPEPPQRTTLVPPAAGDDRAVRHTTAAANGISPATGSEVRALAPPALQIDSIAVERLAEPDPMPVEPLETPSIALDPIGEGDRP